MNQWPNPIDTPLASASLFVAITVCAAVLVTWLAERWVTVAVWRRRLWRASFIAIGVGIVAEISGINTWVSLSLAQFEATGEQAAIHSDADSSSATDHSANHHEMKRNDSTGAKNSTSNPIDSEKFVYESADFDWVHERVMALPLSTGQHEADIAGKHSWKQPDLAAAVITEMTARNPQSGASESEVAALAQVIASPGQPRIPIAAATWIWVAGSGGFAVWFMARHFLVVWFTLRHTYACTQETSDHAVESAKRMTRHRVHVCQSDRLGSPMVLGVLRPILVFPADFAHMLSDKQIQAVLAHELSHVAGRDPSWQLGFDFVATLLWWHPGVWLARWRHHVNCEAAADENAANLPGGSRNLAAALVRIARRMTAAPHFGWAAVQGGRRRRSRLSRRVRHLLGDDVARTRLSNCRLPRRATTAAALSLIPAVLLFSVVARAAVFQPDLVSGGNEMSLWKHSFRSSLAAAALAGFVGMAPAQDADEEHVEIEVHEQDGERRVERRVRRVTEHDTDADLTRQARQVDVEVELEQRSAREHHAELAKQIARLQMQLEKARAELARAKQNAGYERDIALAKQMNAKATLEAQVKEKPLVLQLDKKKLDELHEHHAHLQDHVEGLTLRLAKELGDKAAKEAHVQLRRTAESHKKQYAVAKQKKKEAAAAIREAIMVLKLKDSEKEELAAEIMKAVSQHLKKAASKEGKHPHAANVTLRTNFAPSREAQEVHRIELDAHRHSQQDAVAQLRSEMHELREQVHHMHEMMQRIMHRLDGDGDEDEIFEEEQEGFFEEEHLHDEAHEHDEGHDHDHDEEDHDHDEDHDERHDRDEDHDHDDDHGEHDDD